MVHKAKEEPLENDDALDGIEFGCMANGYIDIRAMETKSSSNVAVSILLLKHVSNQNYIDLELLAIQCHFNRFNGPGH